MKISELLTGKIAEACFEKESLQEKMKGLEAIELLGIQEDSRFVKEGFMFFLRETQAEKAKLYLEKALKQGAVAFGLALEYREFFESLKQELLSTGSYQTLPPFFYFKGDLRECFAWACAKFYGTSTWEHFPLIAITGTDGKTTTTHILAHLLHRSLYPQAVGTIGTLGEGLFGQKLRHATYSMPPPAFLHATLSKLQEQGAKAIVMEATSQGLAQKRNYGLDYRLALFLNLTEDHLDVHKTKENYIHSKSLLFQDLSPEADAVFNLEDEHTPYMEAKTKAKCHYFKLCQNRAEALALKESLLKEKKVGKLLLSFDVKNQGKGQVFQTLCCDFSKETHFEGEYSFYLPLQALYNVKNASAALLGAWILGATLEELQGALELLPEVAGRMQEVVLEDLKQKTAPKCYVDFAHTEAGIRHVLGHFKKQKAKGKLWVFCNAAGDREREKRLSVARACFELADEVILTLEDLGKENPKQVLKDLLQGVPENRAFYVAPLRIEALRLALMEMKDEDTLLLLSLGEQHSVNFGGTAYPYTEEKALQMALLERQMRKYLEEQGLDIQGKGFTPTSDYLKNYYVKDKAELETF